MDINERLCKVHTMKRGFTLIELLVVVVIVGVLAAIAVPNLLEAQTRSKVARTVSDFRTVAVGLEQYCVDHNRYPPSMKPLSALSSRRLDLRPFLTTPVAYLATTPIDEQFNPIDLQTRRGENPLLYAYLNYADYQLMNTLAGRPPEYHLGAFVEDHGYELRSIGPDRILCSRSIPHQHPLPAYDPTNGTVSEGDVYMTKRFKSWSPGGLGTTAHY